MTGTGSSRIDPVVLSGEAGTPPGPLSRTLRPEQLLPLDLEPTVLQETAGRAAGEGVAAPLVICKQEHRFVIAERRRVIVVRSGAYLAEDDVVRLEDLCGRGPVEGSR